MEPVEELSMFWRLNDPCFFDAQHVQVVTGSQTHPASSHLKSVGKRYEDPWDPAENQARRFLLTKSQGIPLSTVSWDSATYDIPRHPMIVLVPIIGGVLHHLRNAQLFRFHTFFSGDGIPSRVCISHDFWTMSLGEKKGKTYLDVSENRGTPKSSILVGFSIINHPLWDTPNFGNTHLLLVDFCEAKHGTGCLVFLVFFRSWNICKIRFSWPFSKQKPNNHWNM